MWILVYRCVQFIYSSLFYMCKFGCKSPSSEEQGVIYSGERVMNHGQHSDLSYELVPVIIEAGKSHNPPPAHWRTRKAGGVIQPESKSLRSPSLSWKAQELEALVSEDRRRWISQLTWRERVDLSSAFLLHLGLWYFGGCPPALVSVISTLSTDSNANLF